MSEKKAAKIQKLQKEMHGIFACFFVRLPIHFLSL